MALALTSIFILTINIFQLSSFNCRKFNEINYPEFKHGAKYELTPEELEMLKLYRFNFIYPGTKWCGPGNKAENDDDLGSAVEADKCCRAHDKCGEVIKSHQTMYNLTNDSFYTRLSCDCDEKFRVCLRSDDSKTASIIGYTYFNVIGTQCFRKDYKIIGCKQYSGLTHSKCIKYNYDTNSEKIYQWFDEPNFSDEIQQ